MRSLSGAITWRDVLVILGTNALQILINKMLKNDDDDFERQKLKEEITTLQTRIGDLEFLIFMMVNNGIEETTAYVQRKMADDPKLRAEFEDLCSIVEKLKMPKAETK
jgi:hypothetical protein